MMTKKRLKVYREKVFKPFLKDLSALLEKYEVTLETSDKYAWSTVKNKHDFCIGEFNGSPEAIKEELNDD